MKLFWLAKSKTGPSFAEIMRLVTDSVKERKDYSLKMHGSRDYVDA